MSESGIADNMDMNQLANQLEQAQEINRKLTKQNRELKAENDRLLEALDDLRYEVDCCGQFGESQKHMLVAKEQAEQLIKEIKGLVKPTESSGGDECEKNMLEIFAAGLTACGYDGLYSDEEPCGCLNSDLAPCGCDLTDCLPGYNDEEMAATQKVDFWITSDRKQERSGGDE